MRDSARRQVSVLVAVVVSLGSLGIVTACGGSTCSAETCGGCCRNGACLNGTITDACGTGGIACDVCVEGQVCSARCIFSEVGAGGGGGASGGGSGGGGGSCTTNCSLGATMCTSGQLRTCTSVGGCPTWGAASACASGACADSATCSIACTASCPTAGASQCVNGQQQLCQMNAQGCLAWSDSMQCAQSMCADPLVCGNCNFSDQNLVACYAMESPGATLRDGARNHFDGQIVGASSRVAGKDGQALSLSGTSNYVQIAHASQLNVTTAHTVEAWVYLPQTISTAAAVVMKGTTFDMRVKDGSGALSCLLPNVRVGTIALNAWTHVACTFGSGALRGYINGARVLNVSGLGAPTASTQPLLLGADQAGATATFAGRLDSVRIYSKALTEAEVCGLAGRTWSGTVCQ